MSPERRNLLFVLLDQQMGVISRIDTHHDAGLMCAKRGSRKLDLRTETEVAMAKQMTHCCRLLLRRLRCSEEGAAQAHIELEQALRKTLDIRYDHPYATCARWNLAAMLDTITSQDAA